MTTSPDVAEPDDTAPDDAAPSRPPTPAWQQVMRAAFLLLLLAAVVLAVARQWHDVRTDLGELSAPALIGAFACLLVSLGFSLLGWRAVLTDLGSSLPLSDAARVFFVGQLGKYLPGSVWPVVAQMDMGRRRGVPRARMAAATLVTIGLSVAAGLLLALLCLPALLSTKAGHYAWVLLALPLVFVALHPAVINRLLALGLRLLRRGDTPVRLSGRGVLVATGWLGVQWVLSGVQAWLLADDLGAHGWRAVAVAFGAFALASTAGLLFLIAPAGAGVREAVLIVAFAPQIGTAAATVLALVSRLLATLADVLVAAVAAAAVRRVGSATDVGGRPSP